ncbi:MAG: phosphoribosylanthranilate isomerase [Bacteroidota bacterium]
MKTKICGLREQQNITELSALHPQWMGFIFTPTSPRYFSAAKQPADLKSLPRSIKKVGVFVNETLENVRATVQQHGLNMIQLHGNETPEYCASLKSDGIEIIKAFSVDDNFDFATTEAYASAIDYFLFDTKGPQFGGNGIAFNWNLLKGKRFLLSGGISPNHVEAIKNFSHPDCIGIDINSRFEISPGIKDVNAIRLFLQHIQP